MKWDWLAGRVSDIWDADVHAVRASVGRLGEERLLQIGDPELVDRTVTELRGLPGWSGVLGGRERGAALGRRAAAVRGRAHRSGRPAATELGGRRGLAVCGAAYDGVGIAACLGSAATAREQDHRRPGLTMMIERW